MKLSEMRERSVDELKDDVVSLRKHLFDLRVKKYFRKLENTSEIPQIRTQIAQMKTIIREKQV